MAHYSVQEYFKIPKTYSRAEWGARTPKHETPTQTPIIYLVIKRTHTDPCYSKEECERVVREIQDEDMDDDDLPDIQYNFLIGNDGTIYECRGWHTAPEPFPNNTRDYTVHLNLRSVLIGLIGDYEKDRPDQKQEMAVLNLVGEGSSKNLLHENTQFLLYRDVIKGRDPYDEE